MSRIGKKPVAMPSGVTASVESGTLTVKGPKGTLSLAMRDEISYDISTDGISVQPANDTKQARKDSVLTPASKLRVRVLEVLQREGYIRGYSEEVLAGQKGLRIELKYFEGQPAIQHLARVSKPGRRVYSAARELPRIRNGLGTIIVSTPRGVLSDAEAREQNVGGEVLAEVF